jgi:adenine-specific DNA-methyltransferase
MEFPKPSELIKEVIVQGLDEDDIILDFFAGSGTTAQAVLELNKEDGGNRKFILVQLPEKTAEDSEAYKAGYKTISDICKERIRRVINKLTEDHPEPVEGSPSQTELDLEKTSPLPQKGNVISSESSNEKSPSLGFHVFKLSPSNFKHWRSDLIESGEDLDKMIDLFDSQLKPGAQEMAMLYELMLKSGYTLTDKIVQKNGFYLVADKLAVVLNKIDQSILDEVLLAMPQTCIILDSLFADNDQLKTNTALQMKDARVEMAVV